MNDGDRIGFSISDGVMDILAQADKNERHEEHTFPLSGDLCQMSSQATFLKNYGIDVKFNNVYPCVKECDKKEALGLIWDYKCEGWWHYRGEYEKLGIVSQDVFKETLTMWVDNHKD